LVFEKLCHFFNTFSLGLGNSGASEPNSGHGGGFVVCQALVGDLDTAVIVVHTFLGCCLRLMSLSFRDSNQMVAQSWEHIFSS
jgi:hypothetical protein